MLLFIPVTFCPSENCFFLSITFYPCYFLSTTDVDNPTVGDTGASSNNYLKKKIYFLYDEVRKLMFLSRSIQLYMLFLAYIILKLKTKYSQKNMLKLDFSLFEQSPHLGLVRTWDGVCLNSVGCTR